MSFKQAVDIDDLDSVVREIFDHVDSIKEYGHVAIHSDEYPKLDERAKKLIKKLKECEEELGKFCNEMTDWYWY